MFLSIPAQKQETPQGLHSASSPQRSSRLPFPSAGFVPKDLLSQYTPPCGRSHPPFGPVCGAGLALLRPGRRPERRARPPLTAQAITRIFAEAARGTCFQVPLTLRLPSGIMAKPGYYFTVMVMLAVGTR